MKSRPPSSRRPAAFVFVLGPSSIPLAAWLLLLLSGSVGAADVVKLRNGQEVKGRVVDLGGNFVEVYFENLASRKILLREIHEMKFDAQGAQPPPKTDVVFLKSGGDLRGEVRLSDDGLRVFVTGPDGTRNSIPRDDAAKIIYRDQSRPESALVYSEEVRRDVRTCIERLGQAGSAESEEKLRSHGVFAIREIREARESAKPGTEAAKALDRILRAYRLREITESPLEELADYYRIIDRGTLDEKRNLLEEMFTRFVEESAPVAKFLIRDPNEPPSVRAWAVDLLGRMQLNRHLVEIYNDPVGGQVQLAAAIALARNRILAGAESVIEALGMDEPALRELAIRTLKDATGVDLGFGANDTPAARRDSIERWRKWWRENREPLQQQARNILSGRYEPGDTPERQKALESWKKACIAWERGRYQEAEAGLRSSVRADPTFLNGQISLGVLLYLHRNKGEEGRKILEDIVRRAHPEVRESEITWIHYYLGHAWELAGESSRAEAQYRRAIGIDPKFFRAVAALGDLKFKSAIGDEKRPVDARRDLLRQTEEHYRSAMTLIENYNAGLETLGLSDLPVETVPPFERQEHNRGILQVKANLRLRKAEMFFGIAKCRSLLGDPSRAAVELTSGIEALGDDRKFGARELLVELHNYRASLYETAGETAAAARDYRRVLADDLDPKNAAAIEGINRLRGKAGASLGEEPSRKPAGVGKRKGGTSKKRTAPADPAAAER